VADARFLQTSPGNGDDIMRGEPLRLVNDENAVHQKILSMKLTVDEGRLSD
jgi:hypothetical protein